MKFNTDKLGEYQTDSALERDVGMWFGFGDEDENGQGTVKLRLLRAGGSNWRYTQYAQKKVAPYRGQTLTPQQQVRTLAEVYAHTVVVDWRGVEDENGDPVPFSEGNVVEFLLAFPELFNDVVQLASNRAVFQQEFIEEVSKDLGKN